MIVDAKLHEPPVTFKWEGANKQTEWDVLLEIELAYMDALGVDRAVLFPAERPWGEYAYSRFPNRFRLVPMVGIYAGKKDGIDPLSPSIAKEIAKQRNTPGVAGIRILGGMNAHWLEDFKATMDACASHGLPIILTATGDLAGAAKVAERYPDLQVILDATGLHQVPGAKPDSPPFKALRDVLTLADHPNMNVYWSDPVSLSEQPFPFGDVTPKLRQLVDAFGAQRVMWASDISRFVGRVGFKVRIPGADGDYVQNHTYAESLFFLRANDQLTPEEKEWILGGTILRILRW